jgi:hypothetical protein
MSFQYASVNDLDEEELHPLDDTYLSGASLTGMGGGAGAGNGSYMITVNNILSRHSGEIRTAAEHAMQPLHQIGRKKIKELVTRQNNTLFSFLQHPERTPGALGIAETLFRRYGHDAPQYRGGSSISRELNVDISMTSVLQDVSSRLAAVTAEAAAAITDASSNTLSVLSHQLRWIFLQYKATGEEVQRLEALLQQKTEMLDKLQKRLPLIMNLTSNSAYPPLLEAFNAYLEQAFQGSQIETTYKELMEAYKKWQVLRELVSLPAIANQNGSQEPTCTVCLTDAITHAIAPCGHTFCTQCVRRMAHQCYVCRGQAREKIKLYFP